MMSASTETITCMRPTPAPLLVVTRPTKPILNGDLAVTIRREDQQLQAFCTVDRRTVTPEVAGSSPVAPVLEALEVGTFCGDSRDAVANLPVRTTSSGNLWAHSAPPRIEAPIAWHI